MRTQEELTAEIARMKEQEKNYNAVAYHEGYAGPEQRMKTQLEILKRRCVLAGLEWMNAEANSVPLANKFGDGTTHINYL
jgi:hypothetical protein